MSDICLPTSAAVPQLPAYYFKNDDVEFNMVDGGAAAGNPVNNYCWIINFQNDF